MSRGKYSPCLPILDEEGFTFNCYGDLPAPWVGGDGYNEKTMFPNYNSQGYDRYGYSAFDANGEYVGVGRGVDRLGYTELEYMSMSDELWENL